MYLATQHKIYTYPGGGGFFMMTPHTKQDIDAIVTATEDLVKEEWSPQCARGRGLGMKRSPA